MPSPSSGNKKAIKLDWKQFAKNICASLYSQNHSETIFAKNMLGKKDQACISIKSISLSAPGMNWILPEVNKNYTSNRGCACLAEANFAPSLGRTF